MGFFSRMKEAKAEKEPEKEAPKEEAAPEQEEKSMATETKPAEKKETKTAAKTAEKKESKPEPKDAEAKPAKNGAYFVSPHPDGGWQVKKANAQKALKRFKTKAEAEAYAKQVANNQGTNVVRQKKDGKIQKKH
jgi:hypothetical protein